MDQVELDINDDWVVAQRGPRNSVDPHRPYAFMVEPERMATGSVENVATIFISNRECPFRCVMCDLWKNTTIERVNDGAVVEQIHWALQRMPQAQHVKLYNAGNFFDGQAIPRGDLDAISDAVSRFDSVIIECHPRLVDQRCLDYADALAPHLEVAMGLETVDPVVLPRLNKRMSLDDFDHACARLHAHGITTRAFILLRTPWQDESTGLEWARQSIDHAFDVGVGCCAVIPTRAGNGALELLQSRGEFAPPSMASIEAVLEYGIGLGRGRVFIDLWDLEQFSTCPSCVAARRARLHAMNLEQRIRPAVVCPCETIS